MKNIIIITYQCSPFRGSEYSVAWNHILKMSADNKITVLYGTSGNHMGDFEEMNKFLINNCVENVKFIQIAPSKLTRALNVLNVKNIFNYSFYLAYNAWHRQVYDYVKILIQKEKFDLIHFLCPIGYREPGYLWKFDIPYIWGPICGVNNTPWKLFKVLSIKGKIRFFIRNIVNILQFNCSLRLKKALKNVDLLLTATSETKTKFANRYNANSIYIPENCLLTSPILNTNKFALPKNKYQFIIVGRLDENKACIILLNALTKVKHKELIDVNIIGEGPVKPLLEEYVKRNGLDDVVKFHGHLPRTKVLEKFENAHLHIITSLSEGNPSVIWEAMTHGVPTLALDHCGMHDTVCEKSGIKIPITDYVQIVSDIAKEINWLLENPERFESLANGTIKCAQNYLWDTRKRAMNEYYNIAIEKYKRSKENKF